MLVFTLTLCIQAFAERFELTRQEAFLYLQEYKGLEFLIEFYDVEHLQSIEETIFSSKITSENVIFDLKKYPKM
jgi:hypothetical protein